MLQCLFPLPALETYAAGLFSWSGEAQTELGLALQEEGRRMGCSRRVGAEAPGPLLKGCGRKMVRHKAHVLIGG